MSDTPWEPPEQPDPQRILEEASYIDPKVGRFGEALAKHIWFHEHALKIDPHLSAVRLSFALSSWKELGAQYAPAMSALRETQQRSKDRALRGVVGTDVDDPFHDYVAICGLFGEDEDAVTLFRVLDVKHPNAAKRAYVFVERLLLSRGEYGYFNTYVDPGKLFPRLAEGLRYNISQSSAPEERLIPARYSGLRLNVRLIAKMISLLVANGRKEEAAAYATEARLLWDEAKYLAEIKRAERGASPELFMTMQEMA
jgi:hypothetical protein